MTRRRAIGSPNVNSEAAGVDASVVVISAHPFSVTAVSKPDLLPVTHRQTLFRTLIEAQDAGQSVAESRKAVAKQYGVSEEVVKEIEREGIDEQWPPL